MPTLTDYEQESIRLPFDLANGHAYQEASHCLGDLLNNLQEIWSEATRADAGELERSLRLSFAKLIRSSGLELLNQNMISPTASNSIDIIAAYMASKGTETLLVEPTFDNLALLFRRRGNRLRPLSEQAFAAALGADTLDALFRKEPTIGALFIVNPNNPTGQTLTASSFRSLCEACKRNSITLIVDNSFRMFNRHPFDDYAVMLDTEVSFISFEDTGKCWPTLDLKLSMMFASSKHVIGLGEYYRELYLGPSPFAVALFAQIFERSRLTGIRTVVWDLVDERRRRLRQVLQGSGLKPLVSRDWSPMPIEWILLEEEDKRDLEVCRELAQQGLGVLPGRHFFWNSVHITPVDNFIRVSLLKPAKEFDSGLEILRQRASRQDASLTSLDP